MIRLAAVHQHDEAVLDPSLEIISGIEGSPTHREETTAKCATINVCFYPFEDDGANVK